MTVIAVGFVSVYANIMVSETAGVCKHKVAIFTSQGRAAGTERGLEFGSYQKQKRTVSGLHLLQIIFVSFRIPKMKKHYITVSLRDIYVQEMITQMHVISCFS